MAGCWWQSNCHCFLWLWMLRDDPSSGAASMSVSDEACALAALQVHEDLQPALLACVEVPALTVMSKLLKTVCCPAVLH